MAKKGYKTVNSFTLLELIVVIAIIAILAAIIAPNAFRAIEKAKVAKAEGDFKAIQTAVMAYYADTGRWPPSDQSHGAGTANDITVETQNFITGENQPPGWDGPYLERWPASPFREKGWFTISQQYYNYIYACYPWGFADVPNTADVYLQAAFCPVSIAKKIKLDIDGTEDLGPPNYAQQTGRIRWHYSGNFLYYIIVENTNCGGGDIP